MKIVHIITSLNDGGAENTLYKICKYDKFNKHIVISFLNSGKYFYLLKRIGIEVYALDVKFYSFYKIFILMKLLRSLKPNIIQTWLIHADLVGGLASILLVFLDSNADFLAYGVGMQSTIQLMAVLATIAAAVVSGFITGKIVLENPAEFADVDDYEDAVWWVGEF